MRRFIDIVSEKMVSPTQTPQFRRWFRNSKVVDDQGNPLRVFHGGHPGIEAFDKSKIGGTFGVDKEGFFFTTNVSYHPAHFQDRVEYYDDMYSANAYAKNVNGSVYPCYLRIEKPYTFEDYCRAIESTPEIEVKNYGHPQNILDDNKRDIIAWAKEEGRDGIIFSHGSDAVFVVWEPSQIKSVFSREFNPDSDLIGEAYNYYDEWEDEEGEDEDRDAPELATYLLPAGTELYHGTNGDFDESRGLHDQVWVSNSEDVAKTFAQWKGDEGTPRITRWRANRDIKLAVLTKEYLDYIKDEYDIQLWPDDLDPILIHLFQNGFEGWTIPDNYGYDEADILIADAGALDYIDSTPLTESLMESPGRTYYHVTFAARVPKIQEQGIVPGKKRNWENTFGGKLGSTKSVYVFSSAIDAAAWAFKMQWHFEKPTAILVLENVPCAFSDDPRPEPHQYVDGEPTWKCTQEAIPAECITRIIPMSNDIAKRVAAARNKGEPFNL